ncbi:MAG: signal peptidase I, partial [Acidimicrobiales bacterium]|nr:signal peptidase I [Acidimicrobiales bacterium]
YAIPSNSMAPTLTPGDRIIVEKSPIDLNGLHRGDVVVFHRPDTLGSNVPDTLVKRLIALGGDTVEARGGTVLVNGTTLPEGYTSGPTRNFGPVVVPAAHVWVMGDNRPDSLDSRRYGPIPSSSIMGTALAVTWPIGHIGPIG